MGLGPSYTKILQSLSRNIPTADLMVIKDPNVPNELLSMEERQVIRSYKFGVTYCKAGQSTEAEMFANTHGIYHQIHQFIDTYRSFCRIFDTRV